MINLDKNKLPLNFTEKEYKCLIKYASRDKILLEYGSGISTVILSDFYKHVFSIEHHKTWYNELVEEVKKINNVNLFLVEPNNKNHVLAYNGVDVEEINTEVGEYLFKDYINFCDNFLFNNVFIDGRARKYCAIKILEKLNSDSLVFFHDFERTYYHDILEFYDKVEFVDKLCVLAKK